MFLRAAVKNNNIYSLIFRNSLFLKNILNPQCPDLVNMVTLVEYH